jgi:hypothetical protein
MKKRLILIAVVLVALTVVLTAFAQTQTGERPQRGRGGFQNMTEEQRTQMRERFQNMSEEERAQFRQRFAGRRRMSREDQLKSIVELESQLAKLKASVEAQPQGRTNYRDLSEEERTKLREQSTKAREVRQAVITAIRAEVDKLSPPRATAEQIAALRELREIRTLAEKEKATEIAKRLAALIEKQTQQMPARGRGGAGGGGQRRGTRQGGRTQ